MPAGLRRAYLLALAPAAMLAPLPLFWSEGANRLALLAFELGVVLLWLRARSGRTVRLSDAAQNALGLAYLAWLGLETATLHLGLLRSVSHLLLFTALAKLASLKRPGEARLALLILFLLTLASASSSTHVSSLVYFAAMAWLAFRTLSRIAVLADFDQAPPERVMSAVPTAGMSAVALAGGAICAVPLFFALPRLHGPFVTAPFRVDDAFSKALSADRVDLESFGAAKRSDRVVLRLSARPALPGAEGLRLREAVFTEYQDGSWLRDPWRGTRRGETTAFPAEGGPRRPGSWVLAADLNVFGQGFLFLPYGVTAVRVEKGRASEIPDGVMLVASRGPVRYEADVRREPPRGKGKGAISPADVPEEVQKYAIELTSDLTEPAAIYRRIESHFLKDFIYTLDAPRGRGDPLAHFLLRAKAGHCEYFASAAAMMLTARGIPARLVTGSYGGEEAFLSDSIVVRAENLHAWVEADLDGSGFQVLDPTPPAGVPPAMRTFSLLSRIAALGREIEFFYDRRILGFDAADQMGAVEALRESVGHAAGLLAAWRRTTKDLLSPRAAGIGLGAAALGLLAFLLARRAGTRPAPATQAYLSLRRLLARRRGALPASTPPAEVARLFAENVPAGAGDAAAVVAVYTASAFGGVEPTPETLRALRERVARLRKLA
jgi:transglutaminase-like putative cysteine protease